MTLGLLVFPPVDGGDDLVAPSPPMMAHLLSLGTQSEDAAEAPRSRAPPLPPPEWDVFTPFYSKWRTPGQMCLVAAHFVMVGARLPSNLNVFFFPYLTGRCYLASASSGVLLSHK